MNVILNRGIVRNTLINTSSSASTHVGLDLNWGFKPPKDDLTPYGAKSKTFLFPQYMILDWDYWEEFVRLSSQESTENPTRLCIPFNFSPDDDKYFWVQMSWVGGWLIVQTTIIKSFIEPISQVE